jgi:hypothetical protein
MKNLIRPAYFLALAAMLASCTSPKPEPITRPAQAVIAPVEITIHTSPAGGIVDWNGNVLGAAPVTIKVTPQKPYPNTYPRWPYNGRMSQKFRARWPDGSMNWEMFGSNEPIPQNIGIVSPALHSSGHLAALDYLRNTYGPDRKLTQKRVGP